jgi:hypothetical protein
MSAGIERRPRQSSSRFHHLTLPEALILMSRPRAQANSSEVEISVDQIFAVMQLCTPMRSLKMRPTVRALRRSTNRVHEHPCGCRGDHVGAQFGVATTSRHNSHRRDESLPPVGDESLPPVGDVVVVGGKGCGTDATTPAGPPDSGVKHSLVVVARYGDKAANPTPSRDAPMTKAAAPAGLRGNTAIVLSGSLRGGALLAARAKSQKCLSHAECASRSSSPRPGIPQEPTPNAATDLDASRRVRWVWPGPLTGAGDVVTLAGCS